MADSYNNYIGRGWTRHEAFDISTDTGSGSVPEGGQPPEMPDGQGGGNPPSGEPLAKPGE